MCTGQQDLIRKNIELNRHTTDSAGGAAIAHELTWGITQRRKLPQQWQAPDVVIAADVVYRQELFQPLLAALEMLSKGHAYCHLKRRRLTPLHLLQGQYCIAKLNKQQAALSQRAMRHRGIARMQMVACG